MKPRKLNFRGSEPASIPKQAFLNQQQQNPQGLARYQPAFRFI